jgi:hypothetical protein
MKRRKKDARIPMRRQTRCEHIEKGCTIYAPPRTGSGNRRMKRGVISVGYDKFTGIDIARTES